MPVTILGKNNPPCPLCEKPFERAAVRDTHYFFCRKDKILIFGDDPLLHQQTSVDPLTGEMIPCSNPACDEKMRVFTRSNGYMKALCPNKRCGAEIEGNPMPDGEYIVPKGEGTKGIEATKSNWKTK